MSEITKLEQNLTVKKIDNKTINLSINNNEMLMSIVGQFDQNLKNLSKLTSTDVYFRGNSITCKGEKENLSIFCEAIKFLINKYFGRDEYFNSVIVKSENNLIGKIENIKILEINQNTLFGKVISNFDQKNHAA